MSNIAIDPDVHRQAQIAELVHQRLEVGQARLEGRVQRRVVRAEEPEQLIHLRQRAAREVVGLRSILRRPGVGRFSAISGVVILGCALVVYASERDQVGASIQSLPDALWWAIVTASTVGYGDEVPVTDQGRLMAVILMLLGVALLAVLTAHVAAYFVDDGRDADRRELLDRITRIDATLNAVEAHLQHLAASEHAPSISPLPKEPR